MAAGDRDRWNGKWTETEVGTSHGSELFELVEPWLTATGDLLEIAGGGSADSLNFARHGLRVTVCDVSDIGLAQARKRAGAENLTISTVERDLEADGLPAGTWDVVTVANYLQRDLFEPMTNALKPGGILGVIIATEKNLEHHPRPGRRYLLDQGELPQMVADVETLHYSERWRENGRHEAHLVARRQL